MVAPLIGAALISGGAQGLSGYFGGKAQEEAQKKAIAEKARSNERARGYINTGTPYTQYNYALQPQRQSVLASYLSGQLQPAQQQLLGQQRTLGQEEINRVAASRGTPAGGHLALTSQLGSNIGLGALQQSEANKQFGLSSSAQDYQLGLADWIRAQEADQRKRELAAYS